MGHCFFIGTTLSDNPVSDHFLALAKELVSRGHRVVMIAPHRRTDLEKPRDNPAIYTWPSERPTKFKDATFFRRLVNEWKPSCLTANFVAVNIMSMVGALARVPVRIAWYHTVTDQIQSDHKSAGWKMSLLRWRKQLAYRMATNIVGNSQASVEDVQATYRLAPERCRVFHNALADPLGRFHLLPEPPHSGRLLCVGRLFCSKGQDVLLRALAQVRNSIPSIHVEFVGEGPARESYEQLASQLGIRDRCTFVGQITHEEVLQRMAGAIATVVPSRSEAFGLVNIESMAVGTPVIASKVGGIVEIVRDGQDGFLVPPDDPAELALKLKELICNSHLRAEMRINARARFLEKFEQRRSVAEQADWHEELVSRAHAFKEKKNYGAPA